MLTSNLGRSVQGSLRVAILASSRWPSSARRADVGVCCWPSRDSAADDPVGHGSDDLALLVGVSRRCTSMRPALLIAYMLADRVVTVTSCSRSARRSHPPLVGFAYLYRSASDRLRQLHGRRRHLRRTHLVELLFLSSRRCRARVLRRSCRSAFARRALMIEMITASRTSQASCRASSASACSTAALIAAPRLPCECRSMPRVSRRSATVGTAWESSRIDEPAPAPAGQGTGAGRVL